jgi:hypothetical protein
MLAKARQQHVFASMIEFSLRWLDVCLESGDEALFGTVAASLASAALYGERVINVERSFPNSADGERPVSLVTAEWTIPEFGQILAPRLRDLLWREPEPKVMTHVLQYWGVDVEPPEVVTVVADPDGGSRHDDPCDHQVTSRKRTMTRATTVNDVADDLFASILASPKQQRRLLSKTFWGRFGYKMRTKERVAQVSRALRERNIVVNLDGEFGLEDKDDWLVLSFIEYRPTPVQMTEQAVETDVPRPDDDWFSRMETREFESEREVEYYFVMPLLEHLGYVEADFAIGYPVEMYEGVRKVKKEADFVVFDGKDRDRDDNALMVVEAKRLGRPITEDVIGQAKAYAIWLTTPYYLATNGKDIRVYLFRGALLPDVPLMSFDRSELRTRWPALYQTLNRAAVLKYKQQLLANLPVNPIPPA